MLIEFSAENFRSIRERQTLSMVAASRLRKKENTFTPKLQGDKVPALLKVAAIYGPNASGKSNLIEAMSIIGRVALRNPTAQSTRLPVDPFRFDPSLHDKPTKLEVHFITRGQRYEFHLELNQTRIVKESLTAYARGKDAVLYLRQYDEGKETYRFDEQNFEGGPDLHNTWAKLTGPQSLFIAQAVANSSEDLSQLRSPLSWLQTGLAAFPANMKHLTKVSQVLALKHETVATEISLFLRELDVPVTKIETESSSDYVPPKWLANSDLDADDDAPPPKTKLTHKTALGEARFGVDEESDGTQNLIGFWVPWSLLQDEIDAHRVLAFDELDSSLHPQLVAALVQRHLKCPAPAQLIFTTHDTHLMDTKLLRRDQFWITERDRNGATQLRSIHDFEGRESEDIEKRYYEGRYRGLPLTRQA